MDAHNFPAFELNDYVRACRAGEHVILLDLRRDKYLGISGVAVEALAAYVRDWPRGDTASSSLHTLKEGAATESDTADLDTLIQQLLEKGIIRYQGDVVSTVRRQRTIDTPSTALVDGYPHVSVPVSVTDIVRFCIAVAKSRTLLRLRPFEAIAARALRLKSRSESDRSGSLRRQFDSDLAARCVIKYQRLRPLLFTSADECLFDSMTLSEFLRFYGLSADWVFGVISVPFSAHCWLQQGGTVLNDVPETVRKYTPILVL